MSDKNNGTKYPVAGVTELRQILEEQDYLCALTGEKLTPDNTSFDHIQPLSKGGSSLKVNLQAVLKDVNKAKADYTMKEFAEICYKILKHRGKDFGYMVRKTK